MREVHPFGNRVVAKLRLPPETTSGGIILTQASQHATEAIVVYTGISGIETGDVILFIPESGYTVNVDGNSWLILNDKEIIGIVYG